MEIGKKLYFDSNGKCIKEIGKRMGYVRLTTLEEDFEGNPIPFSNLIQLEFGQNTHIDYGSIWLIDGELISYPKVKMSADKNSIVSDGVELAIIQVITQPAHNESITLSIPELNESINFDITNGVGELEFLSEIEGDYTLIIEHELYGNCSVKIKVV